MSALRNLRSFVVLLVILGVVTAGAFVAAARWHWAGELAASIRWQLGWLAGAASALLCALRARRASLFVLALSVWLLWPGGVLYLPRLGGPPEGTPLRVATINVLMSNRDGARVREWIRAEDPDVVAVQEVSLYWLDELRQLADVLPYRVTSPSEDVPFNAATFGMAVLSKRPLTVVERFSHLGRSGGIVAELDVEGTTVRIVAAHPERPGRSERVPRRNTVLAMVAERAAVTSACIVLGDLNTSSGSPAFERLLADGHLSDSRRGFGRQPTWCWERPIHDLWVDIDHVLVSARFAVVDRRVGPRTGSDHRPVAADLSLRPATLR